MIKVAKNIENIPESLSNDKFKKHYEKYKNNAVKASNIYYSAKDVKKELKKLYNNKCAYCESIEFEPETDHYRPVSKYPYLAYEWTNLLPTCHSCNLNKQDKFEIDNIKNKNLAITNIKKLNKIEAPLIINPEVDNPEKYFEYSETEGKVIAKNNNNRADTTINTCKLNRIDLIERRKKKYDNIKQLISYITLYSLKNSTHKKKLQQFIENLKNKTKIQNEFSALHTQIWNGFEKNIAPIFKDEKLINFVLTEYSSITK